MVVVAVVGLIKPGEFVRFWRLSRLEFWVAAVTAIVGLFFGLLVAVLVGVLLTLFLVLRELGHIGFTELQATADGTDVQVAGTTTAPIPGLLILRLDGPLYTANVRSANRRLLAAVDEHEREREHVDTLVMDASAQGRLPLSVADELDGLERELTARGVTLWLAGIPPLTLAVARRLPSWREYELEGKVHPTALAAVRAYRSR